MRDSPLSDFDLMVGRLVNWGRWGRQDSCKPDCNAGSGSIYGMGRADRQGEQIIDGEIEADDDPPPRIDSQDAENLDTMIHKLRGAHYNAVRRYFYRFQPINRELVAESIRALCDMEQGNNSRIRARTA